MDASIDVQDEMVNNLEKRFKENKIYVSKEC